MHAWAITPLPFSIPRTRSNTHSPPRFADDLSHTAAVLISTGSVFSHDIKRLFSIWHAPLSFARRQARASLRERSQSQLARLYGARTNSAVVIVSSLVRRIGRYSEKKGWRALSSPPSRHARRRGMCPRLFLEASSVRIVICARSRSNVPQAARLQSCGTVISETVLARHRLQLCSAVAGVRASTERKETCDQEYHATTTHASHLGRSIPPTAARVRNDARSPVTPDTIPAFQPASTAPGRSALSRRAAFRTLLGAGS